MPSLVRGKAWTFTLNNYSEDEHIELLDRLNVESGNVDYSIIGRERGDNGTPHLQGYCICRTRRTFASFKQLVGDRCHIERARASPSVNREYCSKEGDFVEFGSCPDNSNRGARVSFTDYSDWVSGYYTRVGSRPSEREIAVAFPALFVRYSRALSTLTNHLCPLPDFGLVDAELRQWQQDLYDSIMLEPDDRTIQFIIDEEGNNGKSFFQRYMLDKHENLVQILGVGKRDDMVHAVNVLKSIFLINIPRDSMQYLQYTVLEQLKDRVLFSPKYNSETKIILKKVHVVVFANEKPDEQKMTYDRYKIINL